MLDDDPTKTLLLQHNAEKWRLMRDGVTLKSAGGNDEDDAHVRVIDFERLEANDFLVVRELWIKHGPYTKRCDLLGFVNGLPLVFIELKRHDKDLKVGSTPTTWITAAIPMAATEGPSRPCFTITPS